MKGLLKKAVSIILSTTLAVSMSTAAMGSASAVCATEHFNPEGYETYRYYFYMPDDWYNEYAESAGIYWWSGDSAPEEWAGYVAEKSDIPNIYYCDVPKDVTTIIWNNTVDGGSNYGDPIMSCAYQTVNIPSEFYEEGDGSDLYPKGLFYANGEPKLNFDNMIYVITSEPEYSFCCFPEIPYVLCGEWYFYYGNGKYGTEPTLEMALENGGYYTQQHCTPGVTPKSCDKLGDVNNDGIIDVSDVTAIQSYLVGINSNSFINRDVMDVDNSGSVDVMDATTIQKYLCQLINELG